MIDRTAVAHALSLAPVAMLVVAGDGRILALNPEMEGLFGYAPGELVGQPVEVLVPQAIRGAHAAHVAAFRRGPSKRAMGNGRELVGVRKNGEDMPLQLGLNAITLDGQSCTVVSAVDISAPLAYRLSHDVPRDAPETAMIMIDQTGAIVLVNEAALVLTGYGRGELLDQPIEMLIPPPLRGRHVPLRDDYVAGGREKEMSPGRTINLLDREGGLIPVQVSLTPVERPQGRGVMCAVVDLRGQLARDRQIAEQNRELTIRNSDLAQFAYSVSHDLKAPLSSLLGLMTLMREDLESGETAGLREDLEQGLEICERSRRKVERILALARDQVDDGIGRVQMRSLVASVWEALVPGVSVSADLDLDLLVEEVETSETGLEVILHNLLSNALNYHDPAKDRLRVHIGTEVADGAFLLRVGDNGVGISEEDRDRMFELFQKLDERAGDGIGLALVKRHVARLGGRIEVDSEPGKGTTFSVRLPLVA